MKAFIYLCILLFIIIFSLYLIWLSSQKCPIKIQKFYLITLTIMLIRYLSLLSLWIVQYQKIIYIIKIKMKSYIEISFDCFDKKDMVYYEM